MGGCPCLFSRVTEDAGNAQAAGREVTLNADGSYTYQPPAGFSGRDWFTYYVTDSAGNKSNYARVTFNVQPVKMALVWNDQPPAAGSDFNEFINVNNDTENSDNVPDNTESTLVSGDKDVAELSLNVNAGDYLLPDHSVVTLKLVAGQDKVRVWQANGSGGFVQILGVGRDSDPPMVGGERFNAVVNEAPFK